MLHNKLTYQATKISRCIATFTFQVLRHTTVHVFLESPKGVKSAIPSPAADTDRCRRRLGRVQAMTSRRHHRLTCLYEMSFRNTAVYQARAIDENTRGRKQLFIVITRRVPVQRAAAVERDEIPYP